MIPGMRKPTNPSGRSVHATSRFTHQPGRPLPNFTSVLFLKLRHTNQLQGPCFMVKLVR